MEDMKREIAVLKAEYKLRWEEHDKHSEERFKLVLDKIDHHNDKFAILFDRFEKLVDRIQCPVHEEKMKSFDNRIRILWGAFITVVVIGIGLGIWMRVIIK